MPLVADRPNLREFNITEENKFFSNPEFGAFYIPPCESFSEITQETLSQLLKMHQQNPLEGYKENYLQFYPEDIFIDRSFQELKKAEQFIKDFFAHFNKDSSIYYEDVINKFRRFISMSPANKKVHCRIELVSGDSCRKFHVDNVERRLIYTFAGPGTQIKHPDNDEFITLPSGSAIIVKGYKYPEFKVTTLHRSPPIAAKKIKRLLFVADCI